MSKFAPKGIDSRKEMLSMATVIQNIKDGKVVSYKFRSCLGRDERGKQITRYTTWHIPDGLTPSKAERTAKAAANEWEKQVKINMKRLEGR